MAPQATRDEPMNEADLVIRKETTGPGIAITITSLHSEGDVSDVVETLRAEHGAEVR